MIASIVPCLAVLGDTAAVFLVDMAVKATVLLLAAWMAAFLLRSSSAATRHRIWSTTFGCLLLLPLLTALLPGFRFPILPPTRDAVANRFTTPTAAEPGSGTGLLDQLAAISTSTPSSSPVPSHVRTPERVPEPTVVGGQAIDQGARQVSRSSEGQSRLPAEPATIDPVPAERSAVAGPTGRSVPWGQLCALLWCAGLVISLIPVVQAVTRTRAIGRVSKPVLEAEACRLFAGLRKALGLKRRVRLVETENALVPMTWGILRPMVVVPESWRKWPHPRQRIVLLHELAHVKRWDTTTQLLARLACAVYWFHPLAWFALREMRAEREMACDDSVLLAGEGPASYAEHLLGIARDYRAMAAVAAVAMAHGSGQGLEQRVRAMLDRTRRRLPLSRAANLILLAGAAIVLVGTAAADPNGKEHPQAQGSAFALPSEASKAEPVRTLSGHESPICLVGFIEDEERVISVARDGCVKVRDVSKGDAVSSWTTIEAAPSGPRGKVHAAALSSDGKTLAVATSDALITLWDVATGEKGHTLKEHTGAILSLAFSPDGKTLVSGGIDRILRLWNTATGQPVREGYDGNSFRIQAVTVSPDGEMIVSGDRDNVVKLWKLHEKRFLTFLPPDGSVLAVACSPTNDALAAGLDHGRVVLWTGTTEQEPKRRILAGHRGDITGLAFGPDGTVLASVGLDGMLRLWDAKTGEKVAATAVHVGGARCLAFGSDGDQLLTGGDNGEVRIWDVAGLKKEDVAEQSRVKIEEPKRSLRITRYEGAVTARLKMLGGAYLATGSEASWSPDAAQVAYRTPDGAIAMLDLRTGEQKTVADRGRDPAWSPKADLLAYVDGWRGAEDLCLKDLSSDEVIGRLKGRAPSWHRDGTILYYQDRDGRLMAVSPGEDGKLSEPEVIRNDVPDGAAISPDGGQLACLDENRLVISDTQTGEVLHVHEVSKQVEGVPAWSPDGKQLACGGRSAGLLLFDSSSRPALRVIRSQVTRPVWSPSGKEMALAVRQGAGIEIWSIATEALKPLVAYHREHHPEKAPAFLDAKFPQAEGQLTALDLAVTPDAKYPAGALGNPLDDLGDLPRGEQKFAGVTFQVGERPIQLGHEYLPQAPNKVAGIPVQRKIARLYVLHGSGYADPYTGNQKSDTIEKYVPRPFRSGAFDAVDDGTIIAYYRVRYADGGDQWIAVAEGRDVRDWCSWSNPFPSRGKIAWEHENELTQVHGNPICLYAGAWENPHPERVVASIEYISAGTRAAPFCAAMTVEEPVSHE